MQVILRIEIRFKHTGNPLCDLKHRTYGLKTRIDWNPAVIPTGAECLRPEAELWSFEPQSAVF